MTKSHSMNTRRSSRPATLERRSTAHTSQASEDDAAQALMTLHLASPTSRNGSTSMSMPTSPVQFRVPEAEDSWRGISDVTERHRKRRRDDVDLPSNGGSSSEHPRANSAGEAMDVDGDVQMNSVQNGSGATSPHQSRTRAYTLANHELPAQVPLTAPMPSRVSNGVRTSEPAGGPANPERETRKRDNNSDEVRKSKPRNFDKVNFGRWQIKTWYHSPYPLATGEDNENASTSNSAKNGAASSKGGAANKRPRGRTPKHNGKASPEEPIPILWVCEWCFKYMKDGAMLDTHSRFCNGKHPPGRKVYARGAHVIWEIDGARDKLYCQNLSLFGKLFIDIKTLFFDCENFLFYVLTEGEGDRDHVLGFFSKEKISYDDYNLACIIVIPPYQRHRYGMLMIEFSYELSRAARKLETPERPLSELGLRSYLTFWIQALIQFFRRLLSIQPEDIRPDYDSPNPVDPLLLHFVGAHLPEMDESRRRRRPLDGMEAQDKIWDGELEKAYNSFNVIAATNGGDDVVYNQKRWMRTSANADGSVTTHAFAKCTLEDISKATGIRMEDIAFALHESGMLKHMEAQDGSVGPKSTVLISRSMVEDVVMKFNIKRMVMENQYVL